MLPQMAFEIPFRLNESLPRLLSILARVICWKERSGRSRGVGGDEYGEGDNVPQPLSAMPRMELAPEVGWTCLGWCLLSLNAIIDEHDQNRPLTQLPILRRTLDFSSSSYMDYGPLAPWHFFVDQYPI